MLFDFTFFIPIPAALNPFSYTRKTEVPIPVQRPQLLPPPTLPSGASRTPSKSWKRPPRPVRFIPDEPSAPLVRKRGWATQEPIPVHPYMRPNPPRTGPFVDITREEVEVEELIAEELPPAKRRRIAESIINTAVNAAIIGTAVGLTAYKLWRGRGVPPEAQLTPTIEQPPPYDQQGWADSTSPVESQELVKHATAPSSPVSTSGSVRRMNPRKVRPTMSSVRARPARRPRPIPSFSGSSSPTRSPLRATRPLDEPVRAVADDMGMEQGEIEDQMDWMSDRLRSLIAEGQKALGKEVVVYGDEPEAEDGGFIDDGADGWADEAGTTVPGVEPNSSRRTGYRTLGRSPTSTSYLQPGPWSGPGRGQSFNL